MSLLRQLWLSVIAASVLAWAGSFFIGVFTARNYLEQQLYAQASDSATSLALSLSQHGKDKATTELLVSALFDSGHFDSIVYLNNDGKPTVERRYSGPTEGAPPWFIRLLSIEARPGEAAVSHRWEQSGVVVAIANPRYAYASLWTGTVRLAGWFALAGTLWAVLVTLLIHWLRLPLRELVTHAQAIGEGRTVEVGVPKVKELRAIARAMNAMGHRVQAMFAEQSNRIEQLRDEANRDAITGIANRGFFLALLRDALHDESATPFGAIALIRISDLPGLNQRLGRHQVDEWLRALAKALQVVASSYTDATVARLNGSDFSLLVPNLDADGSRQLGDQCKAMLKQLQRDGYQETDRTDALGFVGVAAYVGNETESIVLARADTALMQAEAGDIFLAAPTAAPLASLHVWRQKLDQALMEKHFEMAVFPVVNQTGEPLHAEGMLRLLDGEERLSAGQFMPAAIRLGKAAELDLVAVGLALDRLRDNAEDVAVNLSAQSVGQAGFRANLAAMLKPYPELSTRLWLEVSEQGLSENLSELSSLTAVLSPLRCKVGIEHFGRHFAAIPRLYALRIDYLKLDGGFIASIDRHKGNQRFVQAVVEVARSLDMRVIAERVHTQEEWETLVRIGVSGLTGPAVTLAEQARGAPGNTHR